MMITPLKSLLQDVRAESILDLATGGGMFAYELACAVSGAKRVVGIDEKQNAIAAAKGACDEYKAHYEISDVDFDFQVADALALPFDDGSFDIVGISNSLHHFENPRRMLDEALRVLRVGGHLAVFEMFDGDMSPDRRTHYLAHTLASKIDSATGVMHKKAYTRAELEGLLTGLSGVSWRIEIFLPPVPENYKDPDMIKHSLGRFARSVESLSDNSLRTELMREHEQIIAHALAHGFAGSPEIVAVGRKG